jgi:hypothetical protein
MKVPYDVEDLDAFMRAAIEFDDSHGLQQFYAGNIGGREGVTTDVAIVKRMAEWLAEKDRGLIENLGFGNDNVTYFRPGLDARATMARGGMKAWINRRSRAEQVEKAKDWVPIVVSLVAITFTALGYFAPRVKTESIEELRGQVVALGAENKRTAKALFVIQSRVDSMVNSPSKAGVLPNRTKSTR